MMRWTSYGLGLVLALGLGQTLRAQPPAPAAPTKNLWSFLCLSPEQRAACKAKFCNSALGKMISNAGKPLSMMTGGMLGGCCPTSPTPDELAKLKENPDLATQAEGAATVIKKSEAEAKARRLSVRYLGTVDCHWWPEAEEALIKALREDPNECVRLEAAWSLNRGCCCTKKTIEALKNSVAGSQRKDKLPAENSVRVMGAAAEALAHCLASYTEEVVPGKDKKDELPKDKTVPSDGTAAAYYQWINTLPMSQIVADARRTMAQAGIMQQPATGPRRAPSGLVEIVGEAFSAPAQSKERGQPVASVQAPQSPYPGAQATHVPAPVEPKERSQPVGTKPAAHSPYAPQQSGALPPPKPADIRPATHLQPESARPIVVLPPVPRSVTHETQLPSPPAVPLPPPMPVQRSQSPPAPPLPPPMPVQRSQSSAPVQGSAAQLVHGVVYGQTVEQRQQAAERLSASPWATHPDSIQALVTAARQDVSPSMRVTCIRCLARLNANHTPVMSTLMTLKADADATVRREAAAALEYLSSLPIAAQAHSSGMGVHQASGRQVPGAR